MSVKHIQKIVVFFLYASAALSFPNKAQAQNILQERRVYYLDATYSMVKPSRLWDPVRNDLAKAINAIEDETTELYVIAFGGNGGTELKIWHDFATDSGKAKIISGFQSFTPETNTMTYLDKPLKDFYDNRIEPDKVNYCFLMTDGKDENPNHTTFPKMLKQWDRKYGDANVYGFYVMLSDAAKDEDIESIITRQRHLWKVETADININLIRLDNQAVFNIRNDRKIELPLYGTGNSLDFSACLPEESGLKVKSCEVLEGKLVVNIDVVGDPASLPETSTYNMMISISNADQFDFLVTDNISVKCLNKKEAAVYTPVGQQKLGKVSHYDKFLFSQANNTPVNHVIEFTFNDDAKANNATFAEFTFVDNNGEEISPEEMTIKIDGKATNSFMVSPTHNKVSVELSFPAEAKRGKHIGFLRITHHNLHRLNSNECGSQTADAFQWVVNNDATINPLKKTVLYLVALITALLLIWFFLLKPIKYPHFSNYRKMVLIKRNGAVVSQFSCNFRGAREVVFASKRQKQSILNRLFTGNVRTVVNSIFEEPLIFLPRKNKKALVKGKGYFANPNPISQSGKAEISAPAEKTIIILQ